MSTFTAQFRSTCADCGGNVEPGDEAVYADDNVVHADKDECLKNPGPTGAVCMKCWTERSVTGACACEPE